jgi:hypothetical protein
VVLCVVMLVAVWFSGMIVLLLCGCFAGGAVGSVVLYSVCVVVWSCAGAGVVWCGVVWLFASDFLLFHRCGAFLVVIWRLASYCCLGVLSIGG